MLLSLIRLPRRSINQKAARSWLEGTRAGSRQAAFPGWGCLEQSPRLRKEHGRFAKWKGKKFRWFPVKATVLFQVIEASYRHIKIIIIRLVECLLLGLKAWYERCHLTGLLARKVSPPD